MTRVDNDVRIAQATVTVGSISGFSSTDGLKDEVGLLPDQEFALLFLRD